MIKVIKYQFSKKPAIALKKKKKKKKIIYS